MAAVEIPGQKATSNHHPASTHPDVKNGTTVPSYAASDDKLLSHIKGDEYPETLPAIWDLFVDSATQHPNKLAIASIHQQGELYGMENLPVDHESYRTQPYIRWTYGELVKTVTRMVDALQKAGVKPGFPIFTFMSNCIEYPVIFWAAATLGCTIVPIHPRNLLNKEEAIHVLTKAISTTSTREVIIFVQNDNLAKQVLDLGILHQILIVAIDTTRSDSGYRSFADFLNLGRSGDVSALLPHRDAAKNWILIVFTSGTTAFPKGVVLNALNWSRWMARRRRAVPLAAGDSILTSLPNNHAFLYLSLLTALCVGAAVVFPGTAFSPQAFPEVMEMEQCTHLPMAPTMIHAVAEVASSRGIKFKSMKNITIGGSKLSTALLKDCFEILGSQGVEIIYGATECGAFTTTGVFTHVDDIVRNGDAAVGWIDLGAEVKICAPGEITPLPRNVEGELHYSGLMRAEGYAGEELPSNFYTDANGQKWFATGDAGTMNEEGLFFIVGRIKDMIIRGGTNISPSAIEFVLAQEPKTKAFNVQVVGKLDPIAGEVPVAISQKAVMEDDIKNIQDTILRHMGPIFLPEEVLTLTQLELQDYPYTLLGKVQKLKLTKVVRDYYARKEAPQQGEPAETDELISKVQKVWKRTVGHAVSIDANVLDFADSITIMRVRDRYAKDLGVKVPLEDILAAMTVRAQVDLLRTTLDQNLVTDTSKPRQVAEKKPGDLTEKDLIHLAGKTQFFSSTKAYVSHQISKFGLAWDDIQAITPASDFTHVLTQADILNTSWSWKFALIAKAGTDKQQLRKSVETMLSYNPILTSFLLSEKAAFGSDVSLHVIPKPSQKLFDVIFRDYGSVATKEEFVKLMYKPYEYEMAVLPGVLIQWLLFDIEETGRAGAIMVVHHATTDASYMQLVFEDLDKALGGASVLDEHISYQTWADSYYSLRTSHEAQLEVGWHFDRLQNLSSHKASVFPALPRPHHFSSSLQHTQSVDDNGYHTDFHARGITKLRRQHPTLSAPNIIKAAWSLLNIYRNGTSTAVFTNLQADRRRFPFVPKALEALSPAHTFEASNVAGLALQDVVNVIPLHVEESVLDFLYRVTADQEALNKYAAAPLRTILEAVGPINSEIMLDIMRSQIFNWTPGLGAMQTQNAYENYEPVGTFIRPSLRLVINVDVGGQDDETCFFQIKSPLYDMDGLQGIAHDFEDFVLWICDETNWHSRTGNFQQALHKTPRSGVQTNGAKKDHVI